MDLGDREFTSEEVADLCGVTRVTVADWISRGKLAVRWTAGGHRRVPRDSLEQLMRQQGYALPRTVESSRASVIVLDRDVARGRAIAAVFTPAEQFDVEILAPGPAAFIAIGARQPDVIAFATRVAGFDAPQLIEAVRDNATTRGAGLIAVMGRREDGATWKRHGCDLVASHDHLVDLRDATIRWLTDAQRRASSDEVSDADRSGARVLVATPPAARAQGRE